jgi:hypothetical protein
MIEFFTTNAVANHQVGLIICRSLKALGPRSENELRTLLIPSYGTIENQKYEQWIRTLAILKHTKIITEIDAQLSLCHELQEIREITHIEFSREFLRCLNKVNLEAIENGETTDDMFQALVWLLSTSNKYLVRKFDDRKNGSTSVYRDIQDFGFKDAITNDSQWNAFRRWARGLGIMRPLDRETDSIDISEFVTALIEVIEVDGPLENFIAQISDYLPILGENKVSSWYRRVTERDTQFVSIGNQLSWSLLTCEHRGLIELTSEDDARVSTMAIPNSLDGGERLVTHIRKLK